jgi:hypothetical protein
MTATCDDQHLPRLTLAQKEPSTHDTTAQILEVLEKYRVKDVAEESPPMAFASRRSFSA